MQIHLRHRWDGALLPASQHASVRLELQPRTLLIHVDAPFHGDPPPPHPVGSTPELWNHEVVELFILGPSERYLEIELGPAGHHLVLSLLGARQPTAMGLPCALRTHVGSTRWTATARVDAALLPPGPWRINAYRIHGPPEQRHYSVHTPLGTAAPDFHAIHAFQTRFERQPG